MSEARKRTLEKHRLEVILGTRHQSPTGGTTWTWARTGRVLKCSISPIAATPDVALLMQQTKRLYTVRFSFDPQLDENIHRMLFLTPVSMFNRFVRIQAPAMDANGQGWMFRLIGEEHTEDLQNRPT